LPTKILHLKFDDYLIEHGVVSDRNYSIVHDRMDRDVQYFGKFHRELGGYHREKGIRDWLRSWCHLAYQKTLTDYLRVALGHLVLDEMWSKYKYEDEYELIKSAYRSYAQKGFYWSFFKER